MSRLSGKLMYLSNFLMPPEYSSKTSLFKWRSKTSLKKKQEKTYLFVKKKEKKKKKIFEEKPEIDGML